MDSQVMRKISRNISDYGIRVTAIKSIERILSPIYEFTVYRIYRIHLDAAPKKQSLEDTDIIVRLLTLEDIDIIRQIENYAEFLQGKIQKLSLKMAFA